MRRLVTVGLMAVVVGCSGGHDAIRPEQPTASDAMGRSTIKAVEGPSSPLVVDWKSEERADLEEAIHDGVAIVAWDDKGLRLLKRCRLAGDYGYLPVQVKKDVVRLETADEVRASLPLGGLGIAGKIGGGFSKGTTLDIALAMVGKRRTTWNDVKRDDLKGQCEGATHYIRAILVGAFTMKTGTASKVAAAAEIFGAGASGSTGSSKDVGSSDGKVDDCDKATGEELKPPGQCAAILRIELEPISKSDTPVVAVVATKAGHEAPEPKSDAIEGCPSGFVFSGGACKQASAERPHICAVSDGADCEAQCTKGNAPSCDRLGTLIANGKKGPRDPAAATAAFDKACAGGDASGCANLGSELMFGAHRDVVQGMKALELGCLRGSARACSTIGESFMRGYAGAKDPARAVRFLAKGCDGGEFTACTNAGFLFTGGGGPGVERNDAKAIEFGRRACFGGESVACGNVGYKVELGEGIAANPVLAAALYERACRLAPSDCFRSGMMLAVGAAGIPKDDARAKGLLERACKTGEGLSPLGCVMGSAIYGMPASANRGSLQQIAEKMKGQCDSKEGRACAFLGLAEYGVGQKSEAQRDFRLSCSLRDPVGCDLGRRMR